ncbi:GGDEF domain-containing protein [Pseudaquabacterium rugosum]|uniref:diguanylate cyclase n=1 Tax=Pseudaquabacterium rugosum TaxID=2984194 RepID=A0ABU9B5P5_9BURK
MNPVQIPVRSDAPPETPVAWGPLLAGTATAGLLAAGLGYGLQHSLPGGASWAGAAIGASVALVSTPLLLLWRARPGGPASTPGAPASARGTAAPAVEQRQRQATADVLRWSLGQDRRGRSAETAAGAATAQPVPPSGAARAPVAAQTLSEALHADAVRDALTGAYTQQHFIAATDREWSRLRRHQEDAALLMVDTDHFRMLNERWGQACGDAMLVETTRQIAAMLRQYDLLARFGGGVLVIYLPHTDPLGALDVAERIRERVAGIRLSWNGETVRATVSVGVAGIGAAHAALDDAIADAGTALRAAKSAGRNCVRAAPIPPRRGADSVSVDRRSV